MWKKILCGITISVITAILLSFCRDFREHQTSIESTIKQQEISITEIKTIMKYYDSRWEKADQWQLSISSKLDKLNDKVIDLYRLQLKNKYGLNLDSTQYAVK